MSRNSHKALLRLILIVTLVVACSKYPILEVKAQMPNLRPPQGYVPDSGSASKMADIVLVAMFGEEYVKSERPFSVELKDQVWIVRGHTFTQPHPGGSVEIKIDKKSACVLSVTRGK